LEHIVKIRGRDPLIYKIIPFFSSHVAKDFKTITNEQDKALEQKYDYSPQTKNVNFFESVFSDAAKAI
jgi:hypothetical protein